MNNSLAQNEDPIFAMFKRLKELIEHIFENKTTDKYLVNSLKLLGTEYVTIKYYRTEDTSTFMPTNVNNSNKSMAVIIVPIIILSVGALYYYKRNHVFR